MGCAGLCLSAAHCRKHRPAKAQVTKSKHKVRGCSGMGRSERKMQIKKNNLQIFIASQSSLCAVQCAEDSP